jgi:DnaJ-domain-containing protein 1
MDPNEILGVPANAPEEEIRAAYLSKVKEFPPDRAPAEFERIRDAYDTLRDPRKRARALFLTAEPGGDCNAPLVSLLEGRRARRIFAGPQPWREVLKTK